MADCDAGHGCTISCPHGCGCMFVHDTGSCSCFCSDIVIHEGNLTDEALAGIQKLGALELTTTVNFSAQELPRSSLAAIFRHILPDAVVFSETRADENISLSLREVPLSEVLKALELLPYR